MLLRKLILCVFAALVFGNKQESRIITIDQGPVRGYKAPEGDFFVYYGIKYASVPTGPSKFKGPLPPPIWDEPFEAVKSNIICPQSRLFQDDRPLIMQEDCLIANIFVPESDVLNLPVFVNIHGGAFQYGHGDGLTPTNLVKTKKIIIITFNYRLGPYGFLCLGTEDIPGNAGLKDQVALLRWVQKNIDAFGGNPNDVTIGGCSAGGASVDLISISKAAQGLFHKVIAQSGSNCASFSVQVDPIQNAKTVARNFNFDTVDDINTLEEFYKNIPLQDLLYVEFANRTNTALIFGPCVERDVGQEMILHDYPENILKEGDFIRLPTLYSISEMEGIIRVEFFSDWKKIMNEKFSDFFPEDLLFNSEEEKDFEIRKVKRHYFGDQPVSEYNILSYVNYFTDVMFAYGTAKAVKLQVEAGNKEVYLYEYSFVDESVDYIPFTNVRGAGHCAQEKAVLDEPHESNFSEEYKRNKHIMREIFLNFITTGKPMSDNSTYPSWPPVSFDRSPYMLINNTLQVKSSFLGRSTVLWDKIYSKYYKHPMPPWPQNISSYGNKSLSVMNIRIASFIIFIYIYKEMFL